MGFDITRGELKSAVESNNLDIQAAAAEISARIIRELMPALERIKAELNIEMIEREKVLEKARKKMAEIEEQRKIRKQIYADIEDGLTFKLCAASRNMSIASVKRLYLQEYKAVEMMVNKSDVAA